VVRLTVSSELGRICDEAVDSNMWYYLQIFLEGLRKVTDNLRQYGLSWSRDLKLRPPE
jgi:hypothetical protein